MIRLKILLKKIILRNYIKLISIITPTFNSEDTLLECLNSVSYQSYKEVEHLIIDGESNDKTLEILHTFRGHCLTCFSEKDEGIYDAVNKGIQKSSGEIIAWLNSDDLFASEDVLCDVAEHFLDPDVQIVYGDINYVNRSNINKVTRRWKAGLYNSRSVKWGWMPPTPAVFFRKSLLDFNNLYNKQYQISGDYEFFLRNHSLFQRSKYIPQVMVLMRLGGVSNAGGWYTVLKLVEDYRAIKSTQTGNILTIPIKSIRKLGQFKLSI